MKIFRNPEVKKITVCYIAVFALVSGVCRMLGYYMCILPLTVLFAAFCSINIYFSNRRYDSLENISFQLDRILHGTTQVDFGRYTEGELSVLKSQLEKVVIRLRQQTEALQKEKINLTDSIADISHQLRTPLTSINLIINFLKREEVTEEKRWELAMELQRLSNRIDWLINALLKISKIDAGTADFHCEKVLISDLLKKRVGPLEIGMDLKDQHFVIKQEGDEFFTGDIHWTGEAIGNLLKNCSEHTPEGGTITAIVQQTAVYTQIEITDSGSGFVPEDIPHLFTRFYKGKNASRESVGIGLALARMIITNQNGTIKADNHPGGGARFTVKFYHGIV
ncbi:MAG: HAMP domain-containing histidine kinase [Oscillospiraceae bacterium]|nr:HAMP domain-containing histidine kinase [Oscillospiraceae bacterium]